MTPLSPKIRPLINQDIPKLNKESASNTSVE